MHYTLEELRSFFIFKFRDLFSTNERISGKGFQAVINAHVFKSPRAKHTTSAALSVTKERLASSSLNDNQMRFGTFNDVGI
jgi:hypothetical protein